MLCLSFNSCPAFPSFFINGSCLRRCCRLQVLVTSFIFSAHKLRILLKEMDNRRHNLLMNKQYIVCTHRISGAENYRLTCCASNVYNISNTNFYYIHDSCTPHCVSLFLIHFVRHIVITNFIKPQIKSTSSECSHITYCAHKILWISVSFFNKYYTNIQTALQFHKVYW